MNNNKIRQLRLRNQLLDARANRSPADVLRQLCAMQSQEWASAQLAIHARGDRVTQRDIIQAREVERSIVLSWSLRGTLHLVAAEDLRWLLALCGEGAIRATRRRYQQLGLTDEIRERGLREIADILTQQGALTRPELAAALDERGIPVAGQAIHHLVRFAALRGLICMGNERGDKLTFALLDGWLPGESHAPSDPLAELARRYLRACAPATKEDFAQWSGLSAGQVRAAWQAVSDDCVSVSTPDDAALTLPQQNINNATEQSLRLLPRYDNYLLSHKRRDFVVSGEHARQVYPGGGLIRACVIRGGLAVASWKLQKRRRSAVVHVAPFATLDNGDMTQLEGESSRLGAFLGLDTTLRIVTA